MRGPSTLLAILLLGLSGSVHASVDRRTVTWDQHPGAHLPLQLHFTDEAGRQVTLADYFGRTPVVLVLTYFSCPELCPMVLQGVGQALRSTGLVAGRDYALLAVSIDPRDTPAQARHEKSALATSIPLLSTAHFLTAADRSAASLAAALGFHYAYDAEHGQFAHPAGFVIIDRRGDINHYFFGIRYAAPQVRTAVLAASRGAAATLADQLLLLCYHFDPTQGRYTLAIINVLRAVGIVAVLLGALGWWRLQSSRVARDKPS